jgi:hypothetical protein
MSKLEDEVKALRAEVDRLKPTPMPTEKEVAAFRDEIHQMKEANAMKGAPSFFSRADLDAMRSACPDNECKEIALRDARAPTGPSSVGIIPSSQTISSVRVGGSGWQRPTSIDRPQPGIQYVDAQLDAQDRRDKAELVRREEAVRRARGG